ncbi:F0F1 ATP synthase subunit epsilon [Aestuariirhabdus litorea]|uniref:F0F1 ATP synthase subunit epsilon n=1 Tax=Aestuariirhabdus litorea TaxID=2528527 RepID=A0A3P3VRI1_9GAMM|nr:F0F1 ATP synthase subunit epsilon [Aestuariirhabdus litorea]RRJ84129.1 F0F1 ATP synthase subunit epsilon [Aestuariirhabdus litorea]RWW97349.1 F0F1 ATP synthase subunit epsilon [Endozoicomonadaceae bacterium GTF-13]
MNCFELQLMDAQQTRVVDSVESFVGSDSSGSFSLWAHHQRFITLLEFGLARYRCRDQTWVYIAMPGALLLFEDNCLQLVSRRFLLDPDYSSISERLTQTLLVEEQALEKARQSLRHMEERVVHELLKNARGLP